MTLYIDTTDNNVVYIALKKGDVCFGEKRFQARFKQAEKLLPEIDRLLKKTGLKLNEIEGIMVANKGGSFTSLRIGVVTANALAYALGSKLNNRQFKSSGRINVVEPKYDREPNISRKE